MFTLPNIITLLEAYGYVMIFPIAIVEGPIVAVLAGFLVSLGHLNWLLVFLVLMAGDMVGDTLYYALGRWGGRGFLHRWGKYVGLTEDRAAAFKKTFAAHDWKIILIGKTQAVGSAVLFAAGVARMPFGKYMFYNVLGGTPKIALFEAVGFFFGAWYGTVSTYMNYAGAASFVLALALLFGYWFFRRRVKEEGRLPE
jgi:membrane protein DedA with SNARE-associated domain